MFICLILFNEKYLKTTLIYLIIQIKTCAHVSKFSFALDKATNSCKDGWNVRRSGSNVPKILH